MSQTTKEQAMKEAVKVAVGFKFLQTGLVSTMAEEDFGKFMEWLN